MSFIYRFPSNNDTSPFSSSLTVLVKQIYDLSRLINFLKIFSTSLEFWLLVEQNIKESLTKINELCLALGFHLLYKHHREDKINIC